jgi:hypothetical protein
LEHLFGTRDRTGISRIRTYFARLGTSVSDRFMMQQREEAIVALRNEIDATKAHCANLIAASEVQAVNQLAAANRLAAAEAALADSIANREKADEVHKQQTIILRQQTLVVARLRSEISVMQQFFETNIFGFLYFRFRRVLMTSIPNAPSFLKKVVPAPIKRFILRRILKTS